MADNTEESGELKKQVEYLKEHYRRLVESISEGVAVVTFDGVITSLSPAFETLIGWPPAQLVGSNFRTLVHPADLPLAIERSQRERNGQRLPPMRLRVLHSSGMYRPVEVSTLPEVKDGTVIGAWVMVRDLSKDEQLERQQKELAQEKRSRQSLIDTLRAAAFRVRSPLTVVNLLVYRLKKQVTDPGDLSLVENIERHVEQLAYLLERILTMAELDSDRAHFSFGPVQLNQLLAYTQTSMQPVTEAKKIALTAEPMAGLPPVRADELQLYRALQEVVENALEYTPENGTVTVRTFRTESHGGIEVRDTGIGIGPELRPHLFDLFYQFNVPTSGPAKLGLGLAIARKIVDKHGGTIHIESTPGNGSTFTITIPLA